jgi:hypothetical protein
MQRLKQLSLALVALCAIGAFAAAAAMASGPPVNTSPPTLSKTAPEIGTIELGGHGTWTESPTSYNDQWMRCSKTGTGCVNIAEATKSTYTVVHADSGHTIALQITAKNGSGEGTATSAVSSPIGPLVSPEILPAPSEKEPLSFTGALSSGEARWEGSVGFQTTCRPVKLSGEFISSTQARHIVITFEECSRSGGLLTYRTESLKGELGYINEAEHTVGLRLAPETGTVFSSLFLNGGETLTGSIIGTLGPANNSPTKTLSFGLAQSAGSNTPARFGGSGEAANVLTRPGGTGGTVGLAAGLTLTTAHEVRLKG